MAKRHSKPKKEYDFLSLLIVDYAASVDASISYAVRDARHYTPDAPVYDFHTRLELQCRSIWPENRADNYYSLTVYGTEPNHQRFSMTLDDCHVRDEQGLRKYARKRGKDVPVYQIPNGIGTIQKIRGSTDWSGCAWLAPQCVSDMLTLLPTVSPLYVSIHELREGRNRFIVGLGLATTNPAEE